MTARFWTYPPEFLDALGAAGIRPTAGTSPALARDTFDGLYRFELRRLRDRQRAGAVPKARYVEHVIALRKKYWLLTLPITAWEKICAG